MEMTKKVAKVPYVTSSDTASAVVEPRKVALVASEPCANSTETAFKEELKKDLSVPRVNSSVSAPAAMEVTKKAASIPYVNPSEAIASEEEPRETVLAAPVPRVNISEISALEEEPKVAILASASMPCVNSSADDAEEESREAAQPVVVPCANRSKTAFQEELRKALSLPRGISSETTTSEVPKEAALAVSVPPVNTSSTPVSEEELTMDSVDTVMKVSVLVQLETLVPPLVYASVAATSTACEVQHNVIVCEVPKVENVNVLANLCDGEISAVKKTVVTSNVTDLLLIDCKVSEDVLIEPIPKDQFDLVVDDVPKISNCININTTKCSNVSEPTSKKKHGRTPVPKTRKSLCTCGADPSSSTLKKKQQQPPPPHGCSGTGSALGRMEVRGRSMDRMHDSRYGEITVSVGAYERLLCYGDSLVRLGGTDNTKNAAGTCISSKGQPKVTIESFGVTTWDLPSYDDPVPRNEEEVNPATATAVSAPASIDVLDFNYPENSDGAFNTVKRRPRRSKQSQKELKSVSASAKVQTDSAKVFPDITGDASNGDEGFVTKKSHEKITDGGTSLDKTSRSPRHRSRKNQTLQDGPDHERLIPNLPGPSKAIPNIVANPSSLTQESNDQVLQKQRQVDQDLPCGDQRAPVPRASASAVVPAPPVDQDLAASSLVREPQHVDLLIGHTSGSGSMDLCYLRDNAANVEYTLVRRHLCCGNYMGPSEEGRYYRSSAEYMTLGVEDPANWEGEESKARGVGALNLAAKSVSYSGSVVEDPVKMELVEPSSGYDDLPLVGIHDADIESPSLQAAQEGSNILNNSDAASSNILANSAECTESVSLDFTGITYLDGLKAHLTVINSGGTDASIRDISLIQKMPGISTSDLLSAKKLDDFSDFLENIGVVSVSAEPEETPTAMVDFRGVIEKKPEPAYLLELKAKLNSGDAPQLNIGDAVSDENESGPSSNEVAVANLIHLETENSVPESRNESSVKFNGVQIQDDFIEEPPAVDYGVELRTEEDSVVVTNDAVSFYNMPHLMYEYFVKTKQDDNPLETLLVDEGSGNVIIDQEVLDESYEVIHSEEESVPFQIIKPVDEFSQLFKLEEISMKSSECEEKCLSYTESFDEAQYAELSACRPGSESSQSAHPRGSGSSDQLFPYNLVIDNPVYSSLGSTSADSTGLFKGICLANAVHDIELAETESLSKEVVSDEYRNYLQDTDQPPISSYGAGTMRRSTSSKPPSTVRIQEDFRKKMDRFLTQNIRFHQQPKYDATWSQQNKKSHSSARGSSSDAAGSSLQARPSRPHDSRQSHRYPAAGQRRPDGAGGSSGGFPEQYSARLAEQLRLLMQEESRQLHLLQHEQRANLSEGALRDALLDRDIEQDVQLEIEALERSLKIKEQQLLQLEEMQLRIQLEQMPSSSRIDSRDQRQCQSFGEIENVIQQTVFLESSSSSPNMKKTRSEPYLATPSLSGSNHPSDDLGEAPATLPRTQSPGRVHEYVNWTPEDVRSLSTTKSKRRSQSSSRRTSSRSVASHSFSGEVLQQLENLRLELQRAEEAIQQRLDRVCLRSRQSMLDMSAGSSDERLEDPGILPLHRKPGEKQRQHKEKHCCRNDKQRHQEEKQRHQDEKHSHRDKKHQNEKHLHQDERRRHHDEDERHVGDQLNDEQLRYPHEEQPLSYVNEAQQQRHLQEQQQRYLDEQQQRHLDEQQQRHLDEQQQRHLDEQQQRHLDEQQQRYLDEQQQRYLDEQQQHLFNEQQQHLFNEQQQHLCDEQQQEQCRVNGVQQTDQDHQERTRKQGNHHHQHKPKQRSKHQKQHHEPEQKLYENTRHQLPDGALEEVVGEQKQKHICGDEPQEKEEKAHSNRPSKKQQHDGRDKTRHSRHSKRRDRRNKDEYPPDDCVVPEPQSEEHLPSHDGPQTNHQGALMENRQDHDPVIADQPLQFYQQMIDDQLVISEQPRRQVMVDQGPEQPFGAHQTEQEYEQFEVLLLQEQQQKQLMVERYEQQEKAKAHHTQQPHVYENQQDHQYEEQRQCGNFLKEQQPASEHQKQLPVVQHQSAISQSGLMKPGLGACAGLLRAGFEIGLSTLVATDQDREQQRGVESLAVAPTSFGEGVGASAATAEEPLHVTRSSYVEVQPQVLDDETFHEKFLHEQQDELTRRALAERLTRSVEQLNATSFRQQDQLRGLEPDDKLTAHHSIDSEKPALENDRRNDKPKTRNLHKDCQVHSLGRSYPDLEYAQALRTSSNRRADVTSGNAVRGVTISAEALMSKHTYVNSRDESSFDPKRDFEAAHQLLLDMVPAPAPAKPKRVSYGDERSKKSHSRTKEKLSHQLLPKHPALESRESDHAILGPHHHSYLDDASDAKDDHLSNDLEDESPATPSPPPPPAITRQYPGNVLQELQLLTLQLQDTERMISRKLDLLVSPSQSRVSSTAPHPPKVHRTRNSHQRVSSLGSACLTSSDYQNNNNSKNNHYKAAGRAERPRRSNSVGCSDMITAAYCTKSRTAPTHKSPRARVRPMTAPNVRQPTSLKGSRAVPKEELRSSQEEDGNDSSLCFAHIKKFWEKEKA